MTRRCPGRCEFSSFVLVERRPGSPDSISDFGRLLLLESDLLAQVFRAFFSCQYFDFCVIGTNFFSCVRALVAKNFRLSWMSPESHFFSSPLEFEQHVLKQFFGGCKQEHAVSTNCNLFPRDIGAFIITVYCIRNNSS